MSCALFNSFVDPEKAEGISAGTQPGDHVHPEVVEALKEIGIDVSNNKPQKLTLELAQTCSLLVTMGCGEACPYVPGLEKEDWPLKDPKERPIEEVRVIRDEVIERIKDLVARKGWNKE